MIKRDITDYLKGLASQYPVLTITGPRQSGKTTLARDVFPDKPYVSLENIDTREFAEEDPRGFLEVYRDGAVFDEVQSFPPLCSYLQEIVDEDPAPSRFIMTGSQQFNIRSRVSQSLAGRSANCTLLPFTCREWFGDRVADETSLEQVLFQGLYPPVYDRGYEPSTWYRNYVQNYIERDVRQLTRIHELRSFQTFVKMCAARTGQLLKYSSIASDCGVSVNTVKGWISVLEASYIIFLLYPHFKNFGKRLIKSPKLYFYDTGLLCSLLSVENPEELRTHSMRGAVFESFIVSEVKKNIYNRGMMDTSYFWRDRSGNEIDLVIEKGEKLNCAEIKSGKTVAADFLSGIRKWQEIAGESAGSASLIYGGNSGYKRSSIDIVPWYRIDSPESTLFE